MRSNHARRFVPGVNDLQLRNALAYVSCTRSSASHATRPVASQPGTPDRRARGRLLEARTVASFGRDPPRRSRGPARSSGVPYRWCYGSLERAVRASYSRSGTIRGLARAVVATASATALALQDFADRSSLCEFRSAAELRESDRLRTATISSREVLSSSHPSETSPMRFAFANSIPSWPRRSPASLPMQRSQRMPLTWIVALVTPRM